VDLINAVCIRAADAKVLDPACGSGSFLVRAYYRKRSLDRRRAHAAILSDLFGCDVALYPAHLATLNLAAREINDEANYPRIARDNFFDIEPREKFCEIPEHGSKKKVPVAIAALDAVVGNPPQVDQRQIDKKTKPRLAVLMDTAFTGTKFSGRADLHCYFWPQAARLLREEAYFGFLTSAQWLDVDYSFHLQRWTLRHFKIIAIMESAVERWFPDARVKTCITILQRRADERERMEICLSCSNAGTCSASPLSTLAMARRIAPTTSASEPRDVGWSSPRHCASFHPVLYTASHVREYQPSLGRPYLQPHRNRGEGSARGVHLHRVDADGGSRPP
jgi:hypothetical protein